MNKEQMINTIKTATDEAVKETLGEVENELIDYAKNVLVSQLINRKHILVERLTDEIAESNNYWIKARDVLYILVVEVVEKIFTKIEKQVINL